MSSQRELGRRREYLNFSFRKRASRATKWHRPEVSSSIRYGVMSLFYHDFIIFFHECPHLIFLVFILQGLKNCRALALKQFARREKIKS